MSPENERKALEAILHGKECANSLKKLIENHHITSVSVEPLIDTILGSFSFVLSFMNAPNLTPHSESSSQRSQKKKICGVESIKHYRDDSPTPLLSDGFFWRKYGQKTIQNSPYQSYRCYYRCTHAKDQNCNASKRVQMIQDSPPVYRTTYVGQHICKAVFSNIDEGHGSKMIDFERYNHVMPESVMPQPASVVHPTIPTEDKAKGHIMNQECDVNDFLVDDDQSWAYQFPPFSPRDFMFLEDLPAFDDNNPFQV